MGLGVALPDDGFFLASQQRKPAHLGEITAQRIIGDQRGLALGGDFGLLGSLQQGIGIFYVGMLVGKRDLDIGFENDLLVLVGIAVMSRENLDVTRFGDRNRARLFCRSLG